MMYGDNFPHMQLHRWIYGDTIGFAMEEYFCFETGKIKERICSNLISVGELQTYPVSEIKKPGVMYDYVENGKMNPFMKSDAEKAWKRRILLSVA